MICNQIYLALKIDVGNYYWGQTSVDVLSLIAQASSDVPLLQMQIVLRGQSTRGGAPGGRTAAPLHVLLLTTQHIIITFT